MKVFQLLTINAVPAKRLAYVPTEAEIIARLLKSKDPADREKADDRKTAWDAWIADTKERGVIEPVKVIKISLSLWEVVDGRNRLAAAKAAGLTEIPAVEVEEAAVNGLILSTLAHRKGVTKGGTAYLALTLHPYLAGQGRGRKEKRNDCAFNSLDELAAATGVSPRTMDEAAKTMAYLSGRPAERSRIEPNIIAGLVDLSAARAGAGGGATTRGEPRRPSSYFSATKTVRSLASQLREADKWAEEDQAAAVVAFQQVFAGLTEAARAILAASLQPAEEAAE